MHIVTLDFETFYGDDYTLSRMTTEAYIRDPRFESILCSFKVDNEKAFWVPRDDIKAALRDTKVTQSAVLCHHAHFDGGILNHYYDTRPKVWLDTLGMARNLHGVNGRLSLEKLAERYGVGVKGKEVLNAKGMRYADFGRDQLRRYGQYSCNDSDLTYALFNLMAPNFSRDELEINDAVIRMFTEPTLTFDVPMLQEYVEWLSTEKVHLLLKAGVQKTDVMSNDKFAAILEGLGIPPPKKVSKTTGKLTWAFAKTDPAMQALQEHPDEIVQVVIEARLKNKTTIAEASAMRLIAMTGRGNATLYYKYSGASGTHRLSGGDKWNSQAMQRITKGVPHTGTVRKALQAQPGEVVVVADSSTIEARMLDWLAGQEDMVEVYRKQDNKTGPDMYCVIGEDIYERVITKKDDPEERQMSKRVKLGFGFGMGWQQFGISVRREAKGKDGKPLVLADAFCVKVHGIYRKKHPMVLKLWRRCDLALKAIANGDIGVNVDYRGVVKTCKDGLVMPGGLKILYPDLKFEPEMTINPDYQSFVVNGGLPPDDVPELIPFKDKWGNPRGEWTFWNGKHRERIYGPKVTENIIQCLARICVFKQCLEASKELRGVAKWCLSSHDEGGFTTHAWNGGLVLETLMRHMRVSPAWAPDLPVNCEGGVHNRYGFAKV